MENRETWLVTGASGFFGSNVPQVLTNVNLVALTRDGSIPSGYHSAAAADLLRPTQLERAIETVSPTVILHAAALASHEECERNPELAFAINAEATRTIAQLAVKAQSKLIYLSTDAVFNGKVGHYAETDQPDPFSVYGKSKLAGEQEVSRVAPGSLIIRSNFFGWSPSGSRSTLEFFVNNLEEGNQIPGYTDFTVTSIYVRDLIRIMSSLAGETGLWHVASADSLTKFDFGITVAQVFGFDSSMITPVAGIGEISRSRDISLNTDKLRAFLETHGLPAPSTQRAGIESALRDQHYGPPQPLDSNR